MNTVDWHADSWFAYHFADDLTEKFKEWWLDFYGPPDHVSDTAEDQDQYWIVCAFAWHGWRSRGERKDS